MAQSGGPGCPTDLLRKDAMIRRVGGTHGSGMRRALFDRPGTQGSCAPGNANSIAATTCSATYDAQLVCAVPLDRPVPDFCRGMNGSLQVCSIQLPSALWLSRERSFPGRQASWVPFVHLAAEPHTGRRSCASDGEIRAHVWAILMKLRVRGASLATLLSIAMFS